MRTEFRTPQVYEDIFLKLADSTKVVSEIQPVKFQKAMKENRGAINLFSPYGDTKDGLERKNPVVVAIGDSVTAGHFELVGDPKEIFLKVDQQGLNEQDIIEITDVRECYLEKFRSKLIDYYEQTSVSVINSGIAGDTMYGMYKRLERDVIRYQPDLIIINGSLNWPIDCNSTNEYKEILTKVVKELKEKADGDLVLMTPNMAIKSPFDNPKSSLQERVEVIRTLAKEEGVCLVDTYYLWESYEKLGHPVTALLANGLNHPSITGHEVFARTLMQLISF